MLTIYNIINLVRMLQIASEEKPFRKPFYLIVNLALGGRWAGKIDDSIFPVQFYIDYIKYYELKDSLPESST